MADIARTNNAIAITGRLVDTEMRFLLSHVFHARERGYQEIRLDFGACDNAYPKTMLAVCCQAISYRETEAIEFELIPPRRPELARLFQNCSWSHLIDPARHEPSRFSGHSQVPATRYSTPSDQCRAVDEIARILLGSVNSMERSDFAAFEWSINEIMDNVLTHSRATTGGVVQLSTFRAQERKVRFIVADAGVGIPNTLREGHKDITSDVDALDRAVREGITRDSSVGQGNGLFGTYQICSHCHGRFELDSGHASLRYFDDSLHVDSRSIPYGGTLVVAEINFSNPTLLGEALRFGGTHFEPADLIELQYETDDRQQMRFVLKEEAEAFGNRPAGTPVRVKLMNLALLNFVWVRRRGG